PSYGLASKRQSLDGCAGLTPHGATSTLRIASRTAGARTRAAAVGPGPELTIMSEGACRRGTARGRGGANDLSARRQRSPRRTWPSVEKSGSVRCGRARTARGPGGEVTTDPARHVVARRRVVTPSAARARRAASQPRLGASATWIRRTQSGQTNGIDLQDAASSRSDDRRAGHGVDRGGGFSGCGEAGDT